MLKIRGLDGNVLKERANARLSTSMAILAFITLAVSAILVLGVRSNALAMDIEAAYGYCQFQDWENGGKWTARNNGTCEPWDRMTVEACLSPAFVGEGGSSSVTIYDPEHSYEADWRVKPATYLIFSMRGACKTIYRTLINWTWRANVGQSAYLKYPVAVTATSARGGEEGNPDVFWIPIHRGCWSGVEDEFGFCVEGPPISIDPKG